MGSLSQKSGGEARVARMGGLKWRRFSFLGDDSASWRGHGDRRNVNRRQREMHLAVGVMRCCRDRMEVEGAVDSLVGVHGQIATVLTSMLYRISM